jgi:hypothetical protein
MAVPDTGILPYDNMFPALIEWQCTPHPAARLNHSGCRLAQIIVSHPQADELVASLKPQFADPRVIFEPGPIKLSYIIETPAGERVLS